MPWMCKKPNCKKQAAYGINNERTVCTYHKTDGMQRIKPYICQETGCNKGANFNYKEEKQRLYCGDHKKSGMVSFTKKCQNEACITEASFGFVRVTHCAQHQQEGMRSFIKKKRCKANNCTLYPVYNVQGSKTGLYCKQHAKAGMQDVRNKRCKFEGCMSITPCFNFPGLSGIYCAEHALKDMVNVKSKKCKNDGCGKQPHFNQPTETTGLYCKEHKLENMIDVGHIKCKAESCSRRPTYNVEGNVIALYCKHHKLNGMVNVKSKSCEHVECNKIAIYNVVGQRPKFCSQHKTNEMINVSDPRCKTEQCDTFAKKLDGYCARCFLHLFPEDERAKCFKLKEQHMVEFINQQFQEEDIVLDKIVNGGCSKRRPDAYMDKFTHVVVVECDEEQHRDYDTTCENKRVMELFQDFGNRPIVFIRFNPDNYTDQNGKKIKSCFSYHKRLDVPCTTDKKEWDRRTTVLKQCLQKHLTTIPEKEVTVEHLFYNEQVVAGYN